MRKYVPLPVSYLASTIEILARPTVVKIMYILLLKKLDKMIRIILFYPKIDILIPAGCEREWIIK